MWQLISGIVLIGIFFILVIMLKRGYQIKEDQEREKQDQNPGKKNK